MFLQDIQVHDTALVLGISLTQQEGGYRLTPTILNKDL